MTAGHSAVVAGLSEQPIHQPSEQARKADRDWIGGDRWVEGSDLVELARSFAERFRGTLDTQSVATSRGEHSCWRPSPGAPSAIERVICVRDLFHSTADQLERLAREVRPVEPRCLIMEPLAGYHRWDPDEVISVLLAESHRLSRVAEELAVDGRLPGGVRRGITLITAELLDHVMAESARQLSEAELALGPR